MNKNGRDLLRALRRGGYEVTITGNNHLRVETPEGPYFMPSTPGRGRAYQNTVAGLRRRGVRI